MFSNRGYKWLPVCYFQVRIQLHSIHWKNCQSICFANSNKQKIWCCLSKWFSELQSNALMQSEMARSNFTTKSKESNCIILHVHYFIFYNIKSYIIYKIDLFILHGEFIFITIKHNKLIFKLFGKSVKYNRKYTSW